jgi:hypothetical protein
MEKNSWRQGNWNAFVVFECTLEVSRERCRNVPDRFKKTAINHAGTYWKIQGHVPPPRKKAAGFAGMSAPYQEWPILVMTPEDLEFGKQQLARVKASGKTAPDQNFGDRVAGFAAEWTVDRWLTAQGIPHTWNNDPKDPKADYFMGGLSIDLKTHATVGGPRGHYDTNLTEAQRTGSGERDWYLFAKLDKTNMTDLWLLGFQTEKVIMADGVFYRKDEITRQKMNAFVDCWCIRYRELINPLEWIEKYAK